MSPVLAETIGTAMLVLLGNGVCANVNLKQTLGNSAGWMVVATGWGLAVAFAVYLVNAQSGAHINPAVTVGLAVIGRFPWQDVPGYVGAQLAGAAIGAVLVWLAYLPHWNATTDAGSIRGSFCTGPAIDQPAANLLSEAIGTFALMLGVLAVVTPQNLLPGSGFQESLGPALVGMIVWSIGLSLGGPTGYAINPARDLGPRIIHAVLPLMHKGDCGWRYAWIPVAGPVAGASAAALFYHHFWSSAVPLSP